MKHLLHLFFCAVFASSFFLLSACGSDEKTADPAPQTGTISGQITPAASVTTVTATSSATPATTTTATPSSAGAYSIANLAPGAYTLTFTPATGFAAPAPQTVTVTAGSTVTATPVTTAAASTNNRATITVGSTTTNASLVVGNLQLNNLSVSLAAATGTSVIFNLDGFNNAAGTFSLSSQTTSSQLIYNEMVGTTGHQWTTAGFLSNGMGTGTVTITSIGSSPRRVSGTFTAMAYPATSATTGTRTISGTFTNVTY